MEEHNFSRKIVCIRYPGIVKNVDNAIDTLGGINNISQTHVTDYKRIEIRFRPNDAYCKPIFGKKHSVRGLLLKVRIFKNKDGSRNVAGTQVVGVVDTMYKFDKYADYQYLPRLPMDDDGTKLKNMLNELVPMGMLGTEWFSLAKHSFLVPPIFSRIDVQCNYAFRSRSNDSDDPTQKAITFRKKRFSISNNVNFNHIDPIPTKPDEKCLETPVDQTILEKITKLFEERPIWSKAEILFVVKASNDDIKKVLSRIAYFYGTGPWQKLWVKFGFDPRKDSSSRIYQVMDFRATNLSGMKRFIKSTYSDTSIMKLAEPSKTCTSKKEIEERQFIFRPSVLPPRRQMIYQYCNLRTPEIQEMISKLGEVLPGALCHEKRGWLPIGFEDSCRLNMNNYVVEKMKELTLEKSFAGSFSNYMEDNDDDEDRDDLNFDENEMEIGSENPAYAYEEIEVEFENSSQNDELMPGPSHANS